MVWMIHDGHLITGDESGPNFLTFVLWFREIFRKNFNQEIDLTGDRTQAHCVRSNNVTPRPGVFNLLSSRANLHLSYNPAGCSHCRLQNHHGYIKHHHRGMGGSPGDAGEVPRT